MFIDGLKTAVAFTKSRKTGFRLRRSLINLGYIRKGGFSTCKLPRNNILILILLFDSNKLLNA